jgi:hypothetical protein
MYATIAIIMCNVSQKVHKGVLIVGITLLVAGRHASRVEIDSIIIIISLSLRSNCHP